MAIITFWLPYMAPTIIAWYRKKHGKYVTIPLGLIAFSNLFLGWTIIAWFLMLANALGKNPVAWFMIHVVAKFLPSTSPGHPAQPNSSNTPAPGPSTCYVCHGRGTITKTALELSAMDAQNTMNQQNQMTRDVPCVTCGGTGHFN